MECICPSPPPKAIPPKLSLHCAAVTLVSKTFNILPPLMGKAQLLSQHLSLQVWSLSFAPACSLNGQPGTLSSGQLEIMSVTNHGFPLPTVCVSHFSKLGHPSCFSKPLSTPLIPWDPVRLHLPESPPSPLWSPGTSPPPNSCWDRFASGD